MDKLFSEGQSITLCTVLGAHLGGASNYLCLPNEPEYEEGNHQVSTFNPIYMVECETTVGYGGFPAAAYNHDATCARCYAPERPTVIMLPAKMTCPETWTMVNAIVIKKL